MIIISPGKNCVVNGSYDSIKVHFMIGTAVIVDGDHSTPDQIGRPKGYIFFAPSITMVSINEKETNSFIFPLFPIL